MFLGCVLLAAACESFLSVNCGLHFTDNARFRVPQEYHGDLHRVTLDYLAQSGMKRARDFLGANQIGRKDGKFVLKGLNLDRLKDLYHERGIRPCVCLERLPAGVPAGATTVEDLVSAYDLGKAVAEHFAGKIDDWEIDNEIDQARAESSWEYATRAKAMALGFRAGNANVRLMPTSICLPTRGPFEAGMYANGLGYYYDTFNYHIYTSPYSHEQKFRELRAFLAKAGVPDLEIAVTETGCDIEGATEEESCVKGIGMHSPRQADLQAEFCVKNQISLMMQGACESHFFFFEALEERGNRKDWGMIRRDGTRKPAYYALQRLSQRIGQATLEGEVEVGSDERGYLFRQPDGSSTLVKWNVSPVDTGKGDHYGEPRDREIKYYDFAAEKQFTVVKRPIPVGKRGPLDPAGRDLSLVLKLNYDRKSFAVTGGKSTLEMKGGSGELTISAWNLSPVAKKGVIRARGGKLEGLPTGEVEIGPFTNASWTVVFTPEGWTNPEGRLEVVAVFNGRKSTKLSVPMICYADELLGDVETYRPDAMNPALWQKNSNARTEEILWNEQEQALEFHAVWDPKDGNQWIYPVFKVPKGSLEGAIAAIFEMKSSQDKVENDFNWANLMIGPWLKYDPPMKVWETRRVSLAGIDLRECERFQLGGGPRGHDLRLFVRNLRFLKRK